MWEPRRLTALPASTACYGGSNCSSDQLRRVVGAARRSLPRDTCLLATSSIGLQNYGGWPPNTPRHVIQAQSEQLYNYVMRLRLTLLRSQLTQLHPTVCSFNQEVAIHYRIQKRASFCAILNPVHCCNTILFLILISRLLLCLSSGLFPLGFSTQTMYHQFFIYITSSQVHNDISTRRIQYINEYRVFSHVFAL
jgi:hypothetical protein